MSHDIIDNKDRKLLEDVKTILSTSEAAKMAVGYFFISGFKVLAKELSTLKEIRLLIGNITDRETIEQIVEGYNRYELSKKRLEEIQYKRRSEIKKSVNETSNAIRHSIELMEQTNEDEETVKSLAALIEEGKLRVKVYTKGRLHAKAYIFDYDSNQKRYEKGIAIVGSSNLTLSALTSNTELNVVVHGNDNHEKLTEWFDNLWIEAEDFNDFLMEELKSSWAIAKITPYDVYMKTLYELVKDRLEDGDKKDILWEDELTKELADFQKIAVKQAIKIIREFNGCFVSDVVGLGKSYIGAAIIKHFVKTENSKPLIVCPAPLVKMWERYNHVYSLNAIVLSIGMLREENSPLLNDSKYLDRDFILIDESHNFRNTNTQRYRVMQQYISLGEKKCCLLTATPRNKSVQDIYNQIKLFHREDVTNLPIEPANLKEYFKLVEAGKRSLPDLLSNILIRRTRNHVLKWYGFDEKTDKPIDPTKFQEYLDGNKRAYVKIGSAKQFFPKRRLQTVNYSIEKVYSNLYQNIRKYLGKPRKNIRKIPKDEMTYARFGLWHYVIPQKKYDENYRELKQAGTNLSGLMRILVFKRLESSVFAFKQTIKRLIEIHTMFLKALDKGFVPAGEEAQKLLYGSDRYEEIEFLDLLENVSKRYDIKDFDVTILRSHIEQDIQVLKQINSIVEPITPEHDDKLQVLREILSKPPLNKGKCLIFTQYAETAQYLYENLNPNGSKKDIDVIYSGNKDISSIVARFSPGSNKEYHPHKSREINLLIATDVLAEGLNLQDCDKIINYDLHWNPVRLIQRFGRIDRIGSKHSTIYGFNFLPETNLDKHLHLQSKLQNRINEIHETIGEDAAILLPDEKLNEDAMYAIYRDQKTIAEFEDEGDKLVSLSESEEMLRQLKHENPNEFERIKNLRNGIRSGMHLEGFQGYYVMCASENFRKLYILNEKGEKVTSDISQVLRYIACDKETPAKELLADHNKVVSNALKQFKQELNFMTTQTSRSLNLTNAQKYVLEKLKEIFECSNDEDFREQLQTLEQAYRQPLTTTIRKELNLLKRNSVEGEALFKALVEIYHKYQLGSLLDLNRKESTRNALPIIICSESFK